MGGASSYNYDYYGGYNNYGYSNYNNGMSWTMFLGIIFVCYKVPPMFPNELGQYARPFFGMNTSTFIYLLSMVSNNMRGGRRGMGGGFGSPYGHYGHRRRGFF